jgi:heat-inducible transcriptional repressor
MLDARKSAILRKVVAEHIETGEPVGSAHVVRDAAIDVSPATVRADMAALEREGYLTHPHTSAGRVPTDLGYRFFVDHLESTDDPHSEEQVAEFFGRAHGELERMLRDTSRLLSALTDHAAVVVGPAHEALVVRSALLTRLAPKVMLLVVVLSNGVVDKHIVDIAEETADADIDDANTVLRELLSGQTFSTLSRPVASHRVEVDRIVAACHRVLTDATVPSSEAGEVYVGGTAKMADQFAAVDTVREVLSVLEQSLVVVTLLSDVLSKGHSVSIGTENSVESLAECSLVVAPYEVDDEVVGTIGVLGPTRMNYPQALTAVALVSRHLGRQLSGG